MAADEALPLGLEGIVKGGVAVVGLGPALWGKEGAPLLYAFVSSCPPWSVGMMTQLDGEALMLERAGNLHSHHSIAPAVPPKEMGGDQSVDDVGTAATNRDCEESRAPPRLL